MTPMGILPVTFYDVMHCLCEVGMMTLKQTEKILRNNRLLHFLSKIMVHVLSYSSNLEV